MSSDEEIEGIDEPLRAAGKGSRWEQFRMPIELSEKTFLEEKFDHYSRVCVQAVPTGHLAHARLLPRKEQTMSLHGGDRNWRNRKRARRPPAQLG